MVSRLQEDDIHFPTLTVDETLKFAARTKMPAASGRISTPPRLFAQSLSETLSRTFSRGFLSKGAKGKDKTVDPEKSGATISPKAEKGGKGGEDGIAPMRKGEFIDELVYTLSTVFGLRHVRGTKVGNAAIRGVSGGERKRVSIAEALATRARLGCWDK